MNAVPVPKAVPPVIALYHLTVAPALAVAPRSTVPVPHLVPGVVLAILFENIIWTAVEVPVEGPAEQVTSQT